MMYIGFGNISLYLSLQMMGLFMVNVIYGIYGALLWKVYENYGDFSVLHCVKIDMTVTHSLTAALDQIRVVASSTSNDPGP